MSKRTYDKADYTAIRNSAIPASLMQIGGRYRFDSADAAAVFYARELDYVKTKSYDKQYPQAKVIDNYSTDLPRADANGKPSTAFVKSLGVSYGYSAQEMRASRMAGKNLDSRKAESAHYQIDAKTNQIAWCGDKEHNLLGVLSPEQNIPV